jgi:hypothetical protein
MNIIRAFLSHSHADKEVVYRVKNELDRHGIFTWIDEFQIGIGESIRQEIDKGISSSNFLVLFLSKKAIESEWVQREIDAAFMKEVESKDTTIIPVLLETCDIPITLKARRYIDMKQDVQTGIAMLIKALMYPRHSVLKAISGLWIGASGALYLSSTGNLIMGKYDWQLGEKSGNIFGHLEQNRIKFNWSWDYSPEHGHGVFILDDSHLKLEGGWWFIDVNIDPDEDLEVLRQQEGFNSWSFNKDEIKKWGQDIHNIYYGLNDFTGQSYTNKIEPNSPDIIEKLSLSGGNTWWKNTNRKAKSTKRKRRK